MKEKTLVNSYSRTFRIDLSAFPDTSCRLLAAAVVIWIGGSPASLPSAHAQASGAGAASSSTTSSSSNSALSNASSAVSEFFKKRPIRSGMTDLKSRFDRWEKDFRSRHDPNPASGREVVTPPPVAETPARASWDWKPQMPDLKGAATRSAIHTADSAKGRGDLDTAVRWYQRALKFDPGNQEAQAKLTATNSLKQKVMATVAPTAPKKGWF
jgi:hypothetical protein